MGAASFPRIDELNAHGLKIGDVSRDELQAMHQSRRGNQGVAFRATVGHMKLGTALGYDRIHCKDSTVKSGQDVHVNPGSQHETLLHVASCQQQGSGFDFQDRHGRQIKLQVINGPRPCSDTRIGTIGPPQTYPTFCLREVALSPSGAGEALRDARRLIAERERREDARLGPAILPVMCPDSTAIDCCSPWAIGSPAEYKANCCRAITVYPGPARLGP